MKALEFVLEVVSEVTLDQKVVLDGIATDLDFNLIEQARINNDVDKGVEHIQEVVGKHVLRAFEKAGMVEINPNDDQRFRLVQGKGYTKKLFEQAYKTVSEHILKQLESILSANAKEQLSKSPKLMH